MQTESDGSRGDDQKKTRLLPASTFLAHDASDEFFALATALERLRGAESPELVLAEYFGQLQRRGDAGKATFAAALEVSLPARGIPGPLLEEAIAVAFKHEAPSIPASTEAKADVSCQDLASLALEWRHQDDAVHGSVEPLLLTDVAHLLKRHWPTQATVVDCGGAIVDCGGGMALDDLVALLRRARPHGNELYHLVKVLGADVDLDRNALFGALFLAGSCRHDEHRPRRECSAQTDIEDAN